MYSDTLAHRMLELLALDVQPENSWRVMLDADGQRVARITPGTTPMRAHRPCYRSAASAESSAFSLSPESRTARSWD